MTSKTLREVDPFLVFNSEIFLTKESFSNSRRIYGFFDLLGDFGGMTEAIVLIAATGDINSIRYLVSNRDLQVFTGQMLD